MLFRRGNVFSSSSEDLHNNHRGGFSLPVLVVSVFSLLTLLVGAPLLWSSLLSPDKVQAQEITAVPTITETFTKIFTVNIPATFKELVTVAALTVEGETIFGDSVTFSGGSVFDGQITLQGDIVGSGVNIDVGSGEITASNILYSLTEGDGIDISTGQTPTVTNSDRGSAQNIFKKVKLGDSNIEADSNTDTLEFAAGSGISLSIDTSNDKLTITNSSIPGFTTSGTYAVLSSGITRAGIGTSTPSNTLEVNSGTADTSGITFTQLTSSSTAGVGGGKVLSVDSGGKIILVSDQTGGTVTAESLLPTATNGMTLYYNGSAWVASNNLFHDGGSVGISNAAPTSRFHVNTNLASKIGVIVQGYTSQTANLQEWRNSSGSILSYVDSNGVFNGSANTSGSLNPGFTTGSVAFQGASGLSQDNANLFWDDTNNRLGIGTTSPNGLIDVKASADGDNYIRFTSSGTPNFSIRQLTSGSNPDLGFYSANTLIMQMFDNGVDTIQLPGELSIGTFNTTNIITARGGVMIGTGSTYYTGTAPSNGLIVEGNVGIGTISPGALFQVGDSATAHTRVTNIGEVDVRYSTDSRVYLSQNLGTGTTGYNSGGIRIRGETTNRYGYILGGTTSGPDDLILNAIAGNVGVGTGAVAPISKFQVNGNTSTALTLFKQSGSGDILTASASGTTRMVLTNAGNLGLGTSSPGTKVHIFQNGQNAQYLKMESQDSGQAYVNSLVLLKTNSNGTAVTSSELGGVDFQAMNSSGTNFTAAKITGHTESIVGATYGRGQLQFLTSDGSVTAATRMTIRYDGSVGIGTTSPGDKLTLFNGNARIQRDDSTVGELGFYWGGNTAYGGKISSNLSSTTSYANAYGLSLGTVFSSIPTSGAYYQVQVRDTFSPTSGTAQSTALALIPTINQTGGANGVSRGLYINPTLTAAADWRALEIANNSGYGIYQSGPSAINYLNGNTGVGTTTPTSKLHVEGLYGNNALVHFNQTGSGDILTASASGTTRLALTNAGSLGLGTNLPASTLHIVNSANQEALILTANATQTNPLLRIYKSDGSTELTRFYPNVADGAFSVGYIFNTANTLSTSGSQLLSVRNNGTAKFVIGYDGSVGIGDDTPSYQLDVAGQIRATSNIIVDAGTGSSNATLLLTGRSAGTASSVNFSSNYTGGLEINPAQAKTHIYGGVSIGSGYTINNAPTNGLVVEGNVGVGSTSPTSKLHVEGLYGNNALARFNQTGAGDILTASASGTTRLTLTNAGNLGLGTNLPTSRLHVVGSDATSSNYGLTVENSTADSSLTFRNDGRLTQTVGGRVNMRIVDGGTGLNGSITLGTSANATGNGAIAIGAASGASGNLGIALGTENSAAGSSTAVGRYIQANGGTSQHFFGQNLGSTALSNATLIGTGLSAVSAGLGVPLSTQETGLIQSARVPQVRVKGLSSQTATAWTASGTTVTATSHGLSTGDPIILLGATNRTYTYVTSVSDANTFVVNSAPDASGTGWNHYGSNSPFNITNGTDGSILLTVSKLGNLGVGTSTFGTSAAKVLAIAGSTAPSTAITDGIQLFAVDQGGSHELRVMDEAANITTLSPHNFSVIGNSSEEMAWSFYSERNSLAINADMTKALRLVEKLSGEKLVYLKDLESGLLLEDGSDATHITELADNGTIGEIAKWNYELWTYVGEVIFEKPVTFLANITFQGRPIFKDKDSAGVLIVPAGQTDMTVTFQKAYTKTPFVELQPVSEYVEFSLSAANNNSFTLKLNTAKDHDVRFHWSATAIENGADFTVQESPTTLPTPSPSPQASPVPSPSILPDPESSSSATISGNVNN